MKRIFCIIVTAVTLISCFTFAAFAQTEILTKPTVFLSGPDEYNIVFATTDYAAAFVEINYGGKTYVYADEYDGLIRTDDYIHTVRVPKSMLDGAKSYTIIARTVDSNSKSGISYESEMRQKWTFVGDSGKNDISIAFFSDLHLKPAEFERANMALDIMNKKMGKVDLIVLNGDITDALPNDMYFAETLLDGAHIISGGSIPVIYARGNHEARGEYAQFIDKYLAFEGGNMYGRVEFGPASFIVADCGEDKPDYQVEYGGLVDFDNYLAEQFDWLKNMGGYDNTKPYHIAISHSPRFFDRRFSKECLEILDGYKTDIQVGGHHHTAELYKGANYPIVIDGGLTSKGFRGGLLKMSGDDINFEVWDNNLKSVFTHSAKTVQKTLAPKESKAVEYAATPALSDIVTKTGIGTKKGSDYSPTVTVPPTVFDCGDNYNIVYVADAGSNLTKAQAVVTAKDGKAYTFTDSKAGNAVSNAVHSITVPKHILEGATYVIKTTYLGSYGAYGENYLYEATKTDIGLTVTSKEYKFAGFDKDGDFTVATFSNAGGISAAVGAKNTLTAEPDVIVLSGNMTDGLYTQKDFINNVLVFANTLSGGTKPVIFTRGEGECYGDFAPYISQILRIKQNGYHSGMYFATRYGDVNVVVCDTAKLISGGYMQKQAKWLKSLKLSGNATFFAGADTEALKQMTADVYTALGGIEYLGDDDGFGTINVYGKNTLTEKKNSVYGSKDVYSKEVQAKIDEGKFVDVTLPSPTFMTNEQKKLEIPHDYAEAVVEKPTDLSWHTLMIYEWNERGLTNVNKSDFHAQPMQCSKFLVMYFNLCGVDFSSLNYENLNKQQKALKFAFDAKVISYEPPILHSFSAEEIEKIVIGNSSKKSQ